MNRSGSINPFSEPQGDGNAFERGSRHPKWRGGTDKLTLKNRQKVYRRYGIGVTLSSNSDTSALSDAPHISPLVDFEAGRNNDVWINHIATIQDVNRIIRKILAYEGALFDEDMPQTSRLVTVTRSQYRLKLENEDRKYRLLIQRTGVIAKPRHKITLLAQLRKEAKMKQKEMVLRQKKDRLKKHNNPIKGFEKLK